MSSIYKVKELTRVLKDSIERNFPFVWVQGQVSNLSRAHSGHLYFSLKDDESSLSAVWFKGNQQGGEHFDPLTGEIYAGGVRPSLAESLENGAEVICAGRLTIYPPRGSYQLVAEIVQAAGKGRLQLEFEFLKEELVKLGYFDQDRKIPLPPSPVRIVVVTSPAGAAVYDFLRIAATRGLPAEIRIYPSVVQGDEAPHKIAAALEIAQIDGWAEILVLIRGGGSLDDLWAFNTRPVVEAIYNARIPVLCGVGHEVDVTLADLAADVRAATPSHAAQLLFTERRELSQRLDELDLDFHAAMQAHFQELEHLLGLQERGLFLLSPATRLDSARLRLDMLARSLMAAMQGVLSDGELALAPCGKPGRTFESLELLIRRNLDGLFGGLGEASVRLGGLDPALPLARGYVLVQKTDGAFLRRPDEVAPGDRLDIVLSSGRVPVAVCPEHTKK